MNWNSRAVSEVAKERIWKEHVATERSKVRIFDQFRKNPHRVAKDKPLSDPINRRGVRFLDREAAFLETIEKRVTTTRGKDQSGSRHAAVETLDLPSIGGGGKAGSKRPAVVVVDSRSQQHEACEEQLPTPRAPAAAQHSETQKKLPDGAAVPPGATTAKSGNEFNFGELWTTMLATPATKYPVPMTEAMELGWSQPKVQPRDPRFTYNHRSTEMTRFARQLSRAKPPKQ